MNVTLSTYPAPILLGNYSVISVTVRENGVNVFAVQRFQNSSVYIAKNDFSVLMPASSFIGRFLYTKWYVNFKKTVLCLGANI